ncbi:MAG: hypothetical protein EON93_23225 [Burkholderiales bacterium]|nr:MAG: hypothetical protein EON93_23225 [Burkholderiales bacterium]
MRSIALPRRPVLAAVALTLGVAMSRELAAGCGLAAFRDRGDIRDFLTKLIGANQPYIRPAGDWDFAAQGPCRNLRFYRLQTVTPRRNSPSERHLAAYSQVEQC